MQYFTSYFYQIRFFKPNMIPLSTALYDPNWFHDFFGQNHMFIDKRHVLNGIRVEKLAPGKECNTLCAGPNNPLDECTLDSSSCSFLKVYRKQLAKIPETYLNEIEALLWKCKEMLGFEEDPVGVFIVHEAPDNKCSERVAIQEWVNSFGYNCKELDYPIK